MKWRYALRFVAVFWLALGLGYGVPSSSAQRVQAISTVTLSAPLTKPEAWDYATRTWGDPWDMNEQGDVFLMYTSCPSPSGAGFTGVTTSGGIWSGTVGTNPSYMFLLNPGYQSSLDTLQDGEARPIDANTYKWITFRMYSNASTTAAFYWMKGNVSEFSEYGVSEVFAISSGWNIYAMYLPSLLDTTPPPGIGAQPWSGSITGLRFDVFGSGRQIKLDWVRISADQTSAGNTISWTGSGMSGSAEIAFDNGDGNGYAPLRYFPSGNSAQPIPTNPTNGQFTLPASLAPGTYGVQVTVGGVSRQSSQEWTFKPAPIAKIVAPSYTSGEDFATAVVGNPWDMGGTDDVDVSWTDGDPAQAGLTYGVSGGVLDITNVDDGKGSCNTSWPHRPLALNLGGGTIDTSKYKYLAYRYKVDNAPDQGAGGEMRVRWLRTGLWWAGRTDDISFYDSGWNTYKLDLSTVDLEAEMSAWNSTSWNVFQLMVNESHRAWKGHLDWVTLTAENQAISKYEVGWNLVNVSSVMTTTIYWDADQNWGNGYAAGPYPVVTETLPVSATGPYTVYLPVVLNNLGAAPSELEADYTYRVDTGGLTPGQLYYIVIELEDGYNTVRWYSELPVRKL
jgi:hypothetical protein